MGFKAIPSAPEQTESRDFLMDLIRRNVQYPTRNVPGMSDVETQGMNILRQWLNQGTPQGVSTGINALTETVSGVDPFTSPQYKSYRQASIDEENRQANAMQRSTRIRGMADSSSGATQVGRVRRTAANDRLGYLGELQDREMNRRLTAAPQLISASENAANLPLRQTSAAMGYGAIPRQIETEQDAAMYDSLVQTLLFPYINQAPKAEEILKEPRFYYEPKTGKTSGMDVLGGLGGAFLGTEAGAGGLFNLLGGAGGAALGGIGALGSAGAGGLSALLALL